MQTVFPSLFLCQECLEMWLCTRHQFLQLLEARGRANAFSTWWVDQHHYAQVSNKSDYDLMTFCIAEPCMSWVFSSCKFLLDFGTIRYPILVFDYSKKNWNCYFMAQKKTILMNIPLKIKFLICIFLNYIF